MNIVERSVDELKLYKRNAKVHTDRQIELIAKSIDLTKGLRQPIVIDSKNVVICGHGRLLAARKLGLKTVPCELVDNLTDDEIKAYRILDNELAKGQTDIDLILSEISDIETIDMSSFDIEIPEKFSIEDIEDFGNYNEEEDEREYFNKTFTFPIDKKEQIIKYSSKHQQEIIDRIIKESEEE